LISLIRTLSNHEASSDILSLHRIELVTGARKPQLRR